MCVRVIKWRKKRLFWCVFLFSFSSWHWMLQHCLVSVRFTFVKKIVTNMLNGVVAVYAANKFRIFFGVFSSFRCLVVYRNALSSGSALTAGWACNSRTQPLTSMCDPRTNAPTGCTWSYRITNPTITRRTNKCVSSRSICDNNLLQFLVEKEIF